ncbi:class I SAM-dependent methyltransferase [Psychroserpens sp.]|uniref:class I SAM-dependent methyltransferase n=1 Tax=Psychroserpens sp. TaxID=2020870 RepID=UPI001B1E952F|nr:class I SAM-dependent methyltransferase [Psychroserpens sp.]MBO6606766.1 class I SAM-dependent methyltransferase [Psychroserpens sp.]MBO6653469.1 class I SAM-dependent methyltransferase [Psychroserpens sp.]MBO6680503.1 class I SAM-dependent methyltransferase [Psychroserpens sp.]MBO6750538.1 class I SAM-dependent methyltransferase [Psychroserpens sp.]MBO6915021.1 class I SAM-dependent methyltransferase [Psychroserpens sp.]
MKRITLVMLISILVVFSEQSYAQKADYVFKSGDVNGIGKWYMGREIAYVMGFQGINWLERSEREEEEKTSKLIKNMRISATDVIADIGAGSGYHVFKMAPLAKEGIVYAVDIQPEMLMAIDVKKDTEKVSNVITIQGAEQTVNLPENSIDKILMVDVYHEFSYPKEMLTSIYSALKPNGQIYLIEYRGEDASVPIKRLHKMTEAQAVREFKASGFDLKENIDNLPWQHCMVFVKE